MKPSAGFLCSVVALSIRCAVAQSPAVDSFYMGLGDIANLPAVGLCRDGKIMVGGNFLDLGVANTYLIGRLGTDGPPDNWWGGVWGEWGSYLNCLGVQSDGSIIVGGNGIVSVGDLARSNIGRILPEGSGDTNFNCNANVEVLSLSIQSDGKILIGGWFNQVNGNDLHNLVRLNNDGSLDTNFSPFYPDAVTSICIQPDGKILALTTLFGLYRLMPDGTFDGSFLQAAGDHSMNTFALQADGKIICAGSNYLARLNADGSPDPTFAPPGATVSGTINALTLEADGGILIGGIFSMLSGFPCTNVARIDASGSVDTSFNPVTDGEVHSILLQADGKSLLTGLFLHMGQYPNQFLRQDIGRLLEQGPATQTLSANGSTLTWLRGGSSPEISYCSFQTSTNGMDWVNLGTGERISGGWQLTNVNVSSVANIRARGLVRSGYRNNSCWFIDSVIGPPIIIDQPASQGCPAGSTIAFSVLPASTAPFTFQWLRHGTNLQDGDYLFGSTNSSLILSNVTGDAADSYSVVISNSSGSVTSAVASLIVSDPIIITPSPNQTVHAGQDISFTADVRGAAPFSYQWYFNGTPVSGATNSVLSLTNVAIDQGGQYSIAVTNQYGSAAALIANLTVSTAGAKVVTITPSVIGSDYTGPITIQISGLELGQTVSLIEYMDLYATGVLDPTADPVLGIFALTDGQRTHVGGAINWNVLGDITATDGTITAILNFAGTKPQLPVGQTLIRMSDGYGNSGTPYTTNILTITNAAYSQSIGGRIFDGIIGLAGALVVLESSNICRGAVLTDAQGYYTLGVKPGTYDVQVFKDSYVLSPGNAPTVNISQSQMVTVDLTMTPASRHISGNVYAPGIYPGGIFLRLKSNSGIAAGFTDPNGNFSVGVLPDVWNAELFEDSGLYRAGFMHVEAGSPGEPVIDARDGDVYFYAVTASASTALIYGRLTNSLGFPLAGVPLFTSSVDPTNYFQSCGLTDTNGNYCAAVQAGQWQLQVGGGGLYNYSIPPAMANLTNGQSLRIDLSAEPIARCSQPIRNGPHQFLFQLDAASNYFYLIEFSTNLTVPNAWQPLAGFSLHADSVLIQDSNATSPERYYRAVRYY